jgi:hypothetical protein
MSELGQSDSTPFTVFDYLGLGFILEPPAVVVHAVMTGEQLQWSHAGYALPFIAIGAVCIYIGRNWATLREKTNTRIVKAVDSLTRSYIVPFVLFLIALIGVAILPIWLWPPSSPVSTVVAHDAPTANDVAAAVVKQLPPASSPTADQVADAVIRKLPATQQSSSNAEITKVNASLQSDKNKLQSDLASVTASRDALQREINSLPRPGPVSPRLGLNDARRWQIAKTLSDANIPRGCRAIQSFNSADSGNPEVRKSIETWGELQIPLAAAGWRFSQGNKTFFPPGFSIVAPSRTAPAGVCGTRLKELLDSLNVSPATVHFDSNAPGLSQCAADDNCIEVTIGNLDTP